MNGLVPDLSDWLLRTLAIGAGVLLLGWLAVRASRVPDTRRRIAGVVVRVAVLVPVFCALPAWLVIHRPALLPPPPAPCDPAPALPQFAEPRGELPAFAVRPDPVPVLPPGDEPLAEVGQPVPPATAPVCQVAASPPAALDMDWRLVGLVGYAAVAMVLLAQLLRGHLVLRRLWRASRPLPNRLAVWVDDRADVRVSDAIPSAVCFGFTRPRVLLPLAFARAATPEQLRWVLAHEADHADRGDHRLAYWVGLGRAVFFAVPWFWLLRRDLRLAQEFLADAAAAREHPADYAAFLVELSATPLTPRRAALAATGVGATRSELYRRVTMLLTPRSDRPSRLWAGVVALSVLAAAVTAAGVTFSAAPDDKPAQPKAEDKPAPKADPEKAKPKELPAEDGDKPADLADFQKKIQDLIRNGNPNPDELRALLAEMQKQMAGQLKEIRPGVFQMQLGRPGQFQFANPFVPAAPAKPAVRLQYEKRLAEFDADIAKAETPEAAAALKKGRDAFVEAMADELKKADEEAKKNPPAQPFPGAQVFPNVPAFPFPNIQGFPAFPNMPNVEVVPFPAFPGQDNPFGGRLATLRPRQSKLGVGVEKVTAALAEQLDLPANTGLVVATVTPGSVADKAGLKKSDVLVKVAGKAVPGEPAEFLDAVGKLKAGEKFDVELIRKGKKEAVKGVELPPEVVPPARRLENLPARGGPAFAQMSVQVNNGDVSIQATADGVTYDITGTAANGRVVPGKIVIEDGEKTAYESLDKVPEKHRPAVEKLLGQVRGLRR